MFRTVHPLRLWQIYEAKNPSCEPAFAIRTNVFPHIVAVCKRRDHRALRVWRRNLWPVPHAGLSRIRWPRRLRAFRVEERHASEPSSQIRVTLKRSVQRIMSGIKFFSTSELLGGGTALATIALIAFGGLPLIQPQSLPAPTRYASVSIPSSDPPAKSSLAQPQDLSDVAGATPEARSPDSRLGTGNSALADSIGAAVPEAATAVEPAAIDRSTAPSAGRPVGLRVQQHGVGVDPQGVFTDVSGPPSSNPPRDARLANGQLRGVPAPPSVSVEPSFIGGWSDDIGRCGTGPKAPLVINSHAAKTADGECDFGVVARKAANRWRIAAICTAQGDFWRAHITLKLTDSNLTWSSERGTETYVRCRPRSRSSRT